MDRKIPITITVSTEQREKAERVGDGNVSEGFRTAIDAYQEGQS